MPVFEGSGGGMKPSSFDINFAIVHLPLQELYKKSEFQFMRKEVVLKIYLLLKCAEKLKYRTLKKICILGQSQYIFLVYCSSTALHKSLPCRVEKLWCPLNWGSRHHRKWDAEKLNKFSGPTRGRWGALKSRQTYSQAGKERGKTAARWAAGFPQQLFLELTCSLKIFQFH